VTLYQESGVFINLRISQAKNLTGTYGTRATLTPLLTFFSCRRLAQRFGPGPRPIQVGLTGWVSKQAKRSPGRLSGRRCRQMRHALTGGDVAWEVGSMLCQPRLSWSRQLINPWQRHSPTWGPVLGARCGTSWHPIASRHYYGWDQISPSSVSRLARVVDNAILVPRQERGSWYKTAVVARPRSLQRQHVVRRILLSTAG